MKPVWNAALNIDNITLVESRVFENHPQWEPKNLELNSDFLAVESLSIDGGQVPRILLYNVNKSKYVWYSISLKESAVTEIDVLSFVLVSLNGKTVIIVANRQTNANVLMYYENRPMILSISQIPNKDDFDKFELVIGDKSLNNAIPLKNLLDYKPEPGFSFGNLEKFILVFFACVAITLVAFYIFKRATAETKLPTRHFKGMRVN